MSTLKNTPKKAGSLDGEISPKVSDQLLEMAREESDAVLARLQSQSGGLSTKEAEARVKRYGLNEIAREKRQSPLRCLWDNVSNPLVLLLIGLGILSYLSFGANFRG